MSIASEELTPQGHGVLDSLPDAFLIIRADDRVAWVNTAAARLLGSKREDVIGRAFDSLLASGERERLRLLARQRRDGWDLPKTCRLRFLRLHDGAEVVTEVRFSEAADQEGELLVLSARDMTEPLRAEELMGRIAQLSGEGAPPLDVDALLEASEPLFAALGWGAALIELVPGACIPRKTLAAPPGDPVGEFVRALHGQRMPLERTPIVERVLKTGRGVFLDNVPTYTPALEGTTTELGQAMERARVMRSAWCPVVSDGKMTHVFAVTGRDLTEHDFVAIQLFSAQLGATLRMTELSAQLVQTERLAAVGEMAAVMAHEVRNPIAVIFNALSGLQRALHPQSDGPLLLEIVRQEADRLRRLVTDLLDFSRPSTPKMQLVTLGPLVHEAVADAREDPTCAEHPRQIAVDVDGECPPVRTDPLLLRRALVNVVLNALQSAPTDGKVSISVHAADKQHVRVRIHNDGPPVPREIAGRIFDPFFTTRPTGVGLGLAMARLVVGQIEGRIELEPGDSGTSFAILLPAAHAHG